MSKLDNLPKLLGDVVDGVKTLWGIISEPVGKILDGIVTTAKNIVTDVVDTQTKGYRTNGNSVFEQTGKYMSDLVDGDFLTDENGNVTANTNLRTKLLYKASKNAYDTFGKLRKGANTLFPKVNANGLNIANTPIKVSGGAAFKVNSNIANNAGGSILNRKAQWLAEQGDDIVGATSKLKIGGRANFVKSAPSNIKLGVNSVTNGADDALKVVSKSNNGARLITKTTTGVTTQLADASTKTKHLGFLGKIIKKFCGFVGNGLKKIAGSKLGKVLAFLNPLTFTRNLAKVTANKLQSIVVKITGRTISETGMASLTGGLSVAFEVGISALDGLTGAAKLFMVDKSEVDWLMRGISAAFGTALNSNFIGFAMTLIIQAIDEVSGSNILKNLATSLYKLLSTPEDYNELMEDQENWKAEYEKYQDRQIMSAYNEQKSTGKINGNISYEEFKQGVIDGRSGFHADYQSRADWNASQNASVIDKVGQGIGNVAKGIGNGIKSAWNWLTGKKEEPEKTSDAKMTSPDYVGNATEEEKKAADNISSSISKINGTMNSSFVKFTSSTDKLRTSMDATGKSYSDSTKELSESLKKYTEELSAKNEELYLNTFNKLNNTNRSSTYTYRSGTHNIPRYGSKYLSGGYGDYNNATYLSQNDPRWKDMEYGGSDTMGNAGCGPTAISMAIKTAKRRATGGYGNDMSNPVSLAKLAQVTGDRDSSGTNWNFVGKALAANGLNGTESIYPSAEYIAKNAAYGNPVILSGISNGPSDPYTKSGHYVTAVGIKDGKILVNDPRGKGYSKAYDPLSLSKATNAAWAVNRGGYGPEDNTDSKLKSVDLNPIFKRYNSASDKGKERVLAKAARKYGNEVIDLIKNNPLNVAGATGSTDELLTWVNRYNTASEKGRKKLLTKINAKFGKDAVDAVKNNELSKSNMYEYDPSGTAKWLSVAAAVKKALADMHVGYSQHNWVTLDIDGIKQKMRTDCSGYVTACLQYYGVLSTTSYMATSAMGANSSLMNGTGFIHSYWTGIENLLPGDIMVTPGSHTEIFVGMIDGKPMVYNVGEDSTANNPNPTMMTMKSYQSIWRPNGSGNARISNNPTFGQGTGATGPDGTDKPQSGWGAALSFIGEAFGRLATGIFNGFEGFSDWAKNWGLPGNGSTDTSYNGGLSSTGTGTFDMSGMSSLSGKEYIPDLNKAWVQELIRRAKSDPNGQAVDLSTYRNPDPTHIIGSNSEFLKVGGPIFAAFAKKHGVKFPSAVMAQSIAEFGWGQSGLSRLAHNYGGIKKGSWKGKTVWFTTKEEANGRMYRDLGEFRVYDSLLEGIEDHFNVIDRARYDAKNNAKNPHEFLTALQQGGYATASNYADPIMSIINSRPELLELDRMVADPSYNADEALNEILGIKSDDINKLLEENKAVINKKANKDINDIHKKATSSAKKVYNNMSREQMISGMGGYGEKGSAKPIRKPLLTTQYANKKIGNKELKKFTNQLRNTDKLRKRSSTKVNYTTSIPASIRSAQSKYMDVNFNGISVHNNSSISPELMMYIAEVLTKIAINTGESSSKLDLLKGLGKKDKYLANREQYEAVNNAVGAYKTKPNNKQYLGTNNQYRDAMNGRAIAQGIGSSK